MGYECTAMGEDGRRSHDEPADADEPLQSSSDDNGSDSGDFVFPDSADDDFVFSDDSDGSNTNNDSDDILSPVTDPDTDTDADTTPDTDADDGDNRGTHDDSRDPSQPLSDLDEGRFDSDRNQTSPDSSSHTDGGRSRRRSRRGPPTDSRDTTGSNDPGRQRPEKRGRSTGSDMPWHKGRGASDRSTSSGSDSRSDSDSDSGSEVSPYPESDRDMDGTDAASDEPARTETTATTKSDGGTLATGDRPVPDTTIDDSLVPDGPTEDEEMPLGEHIEEMVRRVLVVVAVMSIVSVLVLPFTYELIDIIWYGILRSASTSLVQPRVYHPLAPILARLKVASLAGFVIALPVFVYQTYRFMRPGLYPRERRYYLASVPTSLILAALGVAFAFFIVLPLIFLYFLSYSQGAAQIAFGLSDTFGLMLLLMGFFALIFQIPLFIMLAVMMGVTSRKWLTDRRLYFWGGFLGVAFLTNPDPTGMVPIIVASSMVILFEGTLLVLKWTDTG
jgi:sec-independent protein translocase protein TatC